MGIQPTGTATITAIHTGMAITRTDTTDRIDITVIPRGPRTTGTGIVFTVTIDIITTIAIKLAVGNKFKGAGSDESSSQLFFEYLTINARS